MYEKAEKYFLSLKSIGRIILNDNKDKDKWIYNDIKYKENIWWI